MEQDIIKFEITNESGEVVCTEFDGRILNFNIEFLSNNHHEPYPIPSNIIRSLKPFEAMREFVVAHNYQPAGFKVVKPIKSSNYAENVDAITFKIFSSSVSAI